MSHTYAKDVFPWANLATDIATRSLTLDGLIDHRHSHQRHAWAKVLLGTDEQLASFIASRVPLAPVNFNAPQDASQALGHYLVPQLERILDKGITREEVRAWYAAYNAGRQYAAKAQGKLTV